MAVTQNCLAENNVSTCFNHVSVFSQIANGQVQLQSLKKRTVNGIPTYRCRDVLFSLVPKKLGLQDADVKRNLGLSLLWQGIPALRAAATRKFPLPAAHNPSAGEEMPWSFGWFGAELILRCDQGKKRISSYREGICNEIVGQN